jgi:c-di-GMP-related signal transduction protein
MGALHVFDRVDSRQSLGAPQMPFEDILRQLRLTESAEQALLYRQGDLGDLLTVTAKFEQDDHSGFAHLHSDYQESPCSRYCDWC